MTTNYHDAVTRMQTIIEQMPVGRVVTAAQLAASIGVSERTVWRYMRDLRAMGHDIQGEAGVGYLLRRRAG